MPDFDLSVTICSWNTRDDLIACLNSLKAAKGECSYEVIVVDNNSEDDSPEVVERDFPWVRLYAMSKNLGFTGGHNFAMEHRKGRHAFLLNSDARVYPGCLKALLLYADAHPDVGIAGPKVLNPDGTLQMSVRRFPNPLAALFRNTIVGRLFPNDRFTRDYLMADFSHDETTSVDWVSGCAMLATEPFLAKVGFMDPEYFMFSEDVDWCWRAHKAGFQVVYVPDAVVTHAIGRSTDKVPNRMIGRFHRSVFRFYVKNMVPEMPAWKRPFAIGLAAIGLTIRASLFIFKNRIDRMRRALAR